MKLILHPGHSKCGSTTIQKAIINNRTGLENQGIVIPDPQMRIRGESGFNPKGETPRVFFRRAMESNDVSELSERLGQIGRRLKGKNAVVLISAENLVNQLRKPAGRNIHLELVRHFDAVKVIYYIRRQDDFLLSAWQQWGYKQGMSLEQFVNKSLAAGSPNYRLAVDFFAELYGREALLVTPVEASWLFESKLITDFFQKMGVDYSGFDLTQDVSNKSLNPALCELLSHSPHLFRDIHDETLKITLERVLGASPVLHQRLPEYLSAERRKKILDKFRDDNLYLSSNYLGGREWPDQLPAGPKQGGAGTKGERNLRNIYSILSVQMELLLKLAENRAK